MQPQGPTLAIKTCGLACSLGGLRSAAAAYRGGLSRARELAEWPYFGEEDCHEHLVVGHPATMISDGFQGTARYIKLGRSALEDFLAHADSIRWNPSRIAFFAVVPPPEEVPLDVMEPAVAAITAPLEESGGTFPYKRTFTGKEGVFQALEAANEIMSAAECDQVLLFAIDSYLETNRLYELLVKDVLHTVNNPVGIMPGEATVFVLLENYDANDRSQVPRLVCHKTVIEEEPTESRDGAESSEQSEGLSEPRSGELLSRVLNSVLDEPLTNGVIYSDYSGEPWRAAELGDALVRASRLSIGDWHREYPAISFGETGVVAPLLAIALSYRATVRRYARAPASLILGSTARACCATVWKRI